jgi:hypothetical protein
MSLKAIHIVFITAATLLAFGFGAWALRNYFAFGGTGVDLATGSVSIACGVVLLVYGKYFLKKLKNIGYL